MKHSFITVLSLLILAGTAIGQTANMPTVRLNTQENIVAVVNGDAISRSSLAAESLQLHGTEVLQDLIDNALISFESARHNITVTSEEINAEILRRAQNFNMTSEELLRLIEDQRGISAEQQRHDIGWRMLLIKLASTRMTITPQELQIEFLRNFGPAVQPRQIVLASRAEAEAVRAEVLQHPETFGRIAMDRSLCLRTGPFAGMTDPIRRHTLHPEVENMLFAMQPGEVSPVVEFPPGHFTVFRVEQHLRPHDVDLPAVQEELFRQIFDARLPQVANQLLHELRSRVQVHIVFGNLELQRHFPGAAAVLVGQQFPGGQHVIPQQELAEATIRKFGNGVLSDMINRRIVEQAARAAGIFISEQDIDNEIREMAFKYLDLLPDGSANTALWIERAMAETGLSEQMYRKNVVVPVLSLKRLTRPYVQVTEADIQRAYEANFGQRVQCLMIVLDSQRRAMEVHGMAMRNRSEEAFMDLAERFSFDPQSRMGRGVIPPIARHTGHPELEAMAFSLQPGEISPIFQVLDKFVILYCIGHTNPEPVPLESVREELIIGLFENMQQHIIARYFEKLHAQATFVNHLTGERQSPIATQGGGNVQ